jgi:hypothetical protein
VPPALLHALSSLASVLASGADLTLLCTTATQPEETALTAFFFHAGLFGRTPAAARDAFFGPVLAPAAAALSALLARAGSLARHRVLFCSTDAGRRALMRAAEPLVLVTRAPRLSQPTAAFPARATASGVVPDPAPQQQLDALSALLRVTPHVVLVDRRYEAALVGARTGSAADAEADQRAVLAAAAVASKTVAQGSRAGVAVVANIDAVF